MAKTSDLMGLGLSAAVATILGESAGGIMTFQSNSTIWAADTIDGADNKTLNICGGGANAAFATPGNRGAYITLEGNESAAPGRFTLGAGTGGLISFQIAGSSSYLINSSGQFQSVLAANEATAAGTPLLGANCPAVTVAAPYKWIKILSSDSSVCYIPVWK